MSTTSNPSKRDRTNTDTAVAKPSRRTFLKGSAATTAGLVVGFHVPFFNKQAMAQGIAAAPISPEVNAWVVVQPNDKVIIRIARSEMGQGSL
ncbi:MAG: twin-arginine translocation signal domain-containing protein, partial [Burkholderiales bacterium]